jgi:hypothetical protein
VPDEKQKVIGLDENNFDLSLNAADLTRLSGLVSRV